jgi:hypothetical protein
MRTLLLLPALVACAKHNAPVGGASAVADGPVNSVVMTSSTGECAVEERVDLTRDGRPDVINCFQLQGDKRALSRRQSDLNNDGRWDFVTLFDGDAGGNLRRKRDEMDTDFDGRVDWIDNFIDGRLKDTEIDTNFDGIRDLYREYDPSGGLVRRTLDTDANGLPDLFEDYKDGRMDRTCRDITSDGKPDPETCKAEPLPAR